MNSWGRAFQSGNGSQVLGASPAYTTALFNGNTVAGRPCARYYRHFHSEQGKWIQNTGTKYDNNFISAVIYTETDPNVAYAQSDQCWLLDGLWMAGGNAPSLTASGINNRGDVVGEYTATGGIVYHSLNRANARAPLFHKDED